VWRCSLQLQTKLRLYQTCIPVYCLFSGTVRNSEASTLLQEDLRKRKLEAFHMRCQCTNWYDFVRNAAPSRSPIFPVFRTLSPRDETRSLFGHVVRPVIILRLIIVHCHGSRRLEPVPASTPAGPPLYMRSDDDQQSAMQMNRCRHLISASISVSHY